MDNENKDLIELKALAKKQTAIIREQQKQIEELIEMNNQLLRPQGMFNKNQGYIG